MANKIIFVLLGLFCLVPAYHAAPASEESSEEMNLKGFVERLKLAAITLEEFQSLYEDILEKGSGIFVNVLKDPKVTEVKTEAMENETKKLQDFLDKLEKAKKENKKEELFELVDEYDDIINLFDSDIKDLTPEGKIIETSLADNGLEDLSKSIKEHFKQFIKKFSAEVDKYIEGLSEKEKNSENKFIAWYEKMTAEEDVDKKIEMFDDFFDADDD